MLLALLKNVSKWVFDLFMNNKIADNEARLYFGDDYDSKEK